mmetsp:Transcript_40405/g.72581  ORF Transcript_40405/g.72581 Transcript_40405/m.72581 type:complete len:257 (-) Transcript_40405:22-792(-)
MPTASVNGIALYYEDSDPDGTTGRLPLIFAHGAMGNTMAWWQQISTLRSKYRCIAYDIRGYGRSPDPTAESMAHLIKDLEGLIDHLKLPKVALLGQSMGGRAALGYTCLNPDRVVALVMADTWGQFEWPELIEKAKQFTIPDGHPRGVAPSFPQEQPALYFLWQQIGGLNPKPRPLLEGPTPGGPKLEEVRTLKVPVLCLVGREDVIFPPAVIKAFADELPHAEFVEVEGAGHSVYFEKADEFNKIVASFIEKQKV